MTRGILLSKRDAPPSPDEVDFYLSKTIESYRELWRRRNRLLGLSVVLASAVLAILYSPDTAGPSASVQMPIIGIKLDTQTGASVLTLLSVLAAVLSVFARISYKIYRSEIQELHRLRFGTDCPIWSLTAIGPVQLVNLFPYVGLAGRFYFVLIMALTGAPFFGIFWMVRLTWGTLSLFSQVAYGTCAVVLGLGVVLTFVIETRTNTILRKLQERTGGK